ncbi:glycosyltransferase [Patescibacteria group bacterium]|nr:glycosyltransferase [Patescibacteria group bacterium]MBU4579943.1 glycosyltransferase [Patescibacteria group bacterium]
MKIAIVHDFLTYWGGAEQVLLSFHRIWPDAPIYTLLYDEKIVREYFPNAKIKASFLQKFPAYLRRRKKYLLPFMAIAPETMNLKDFDLVISSSSSFSKGIIVKPKTIHISYCHTPTRFLWDWYFEYLRENELGIIKKSFAVPILHYLRMWDKSVADRVDYFIANSISTQKRIAKFYRTKSQVIYPPVDTNKFKVQSSPKDKPTGQAKLKVKERDYFLIVSRLSAYKKIDIAIEAFNKLDWPLYIIGDGEQKEYLKSIAGKNITFLGFVKEKDLPGYYRNARALIFPGEDDFGIAPVEAMSAGTPVIALRKGGAKETIIEGATGDFFDYSAAPLIAEAVVRFSENEKKYNREIIARHAEKFSRERFERDIKDYVRKIVGEEKK